MPNVITFTPRPRPVVPPPALPPADFDLRAHLEEAAATALDAADKIIATLDLIDDRRVIESKPIPVAMPADPIRLPEPIEAQAKEVAEAQDANTEITSTPISDPIILPEPIEPAPPLRWYGAGNIISATGIALFSLVAGA